MKISEAWLIYDLQRRIQISVNHSQLFPELSNTLKNKSQTVRRQRCRIGLKDVSRVKTKKELLLPGALNDGLDSCKRTNFELTNAPN